jgi:competence protein ComEC
MNAQVSHFKTYFRWYLLLILVVFSVILWRAYEHENRHGILTFAVLDIGQGDAIYIESPTGTQVLVDGGPGNNLLRALPEVMPWYDRHIDMIVVTNPDKDHYEGFIPLLDKYNIDAVLESGTHSPTDTYAYLENKIKQKGIPESFGRRGEKIDLGGGAYLEVLFPDRDVSGLSSNDGSLVMKLVYGDTSVMLQGDSTAKIEDYLLTNTATSTLHSTILKAGHHGSKTSSTPEYVAAVAPAITVASSGVDNDYGHPNKETVATMQSDNIPFYDTCNNGTLIFESDGKDFVLKNKNPKPAVVGCKTN